MSRLPPVIVSRPAIILRVVVFPQPEGPTRTTNWPSSTSRLRLEMTLWTPNDFSMLTSEILAMYAWKDESELSLNCACHFAAGESAIKDQKENDDRDLRNDQ